MRQPLPGISQAQSGDQGKMSARTVAHQRYPAARDTKPFSILPDKICRLFCIVMCGGIGVFRRQAILNCNHPATAVKSELTQLIIMRGKSTADKTAAVIIDNGR